MLRPRVFWTILPGSGSGQDKYLEKRWARIKLATALNVRDEVLSSWARAKTTVRERNNLRIESS
jgi:hypothetical protein